MGFIITESKYELLLSEKSFPGYFFNGCSVQPAHRMWLGMWARSVHGSVKILLTLSYLGLQIT